MTRARQNALPQYIVNNTRSLYWGYLTLYNNTTQRRSGLEWTTKENEMWSASSRKQYICFICKCFFFSYGNHTGICVCLQRSIDRFVASEWDRRKKFPCVPLKQTGSPAISSEANKHRVKLLWELQSCHSATVLRRRVKFHDYKLKPFT